MKKHKLLALLLSLALLVGVLAACGGGAGSSAPAAEPESTPAADTPSSAPAADAGALPYEGVTLSLLKDGDSADAGIEAVIALAEEKLGMVVEIEYRVSGSDGDNLVKTRLASGEMSDLLMYNCGSLLAALNPAEYFIDLSGQPFADTIDDTFRDAASVDGALYGVPFTSSSAGAVVYNKAIYEELELEVPHTWDDFLTNCETIEAAGYDAMIGSFADAWTSQVVFLGDNYNIIAAEPDFAAEFEAGAAKYATTPVGLQSFQKMVDLHPYYNEDYLATTFDDACDKLAMGEGAHWIMLTQVLTTINELYPEAIDDMGVFGVPGDDAADHGLTVWMPSAIYGNKDAENQDAIIAFLEFYVSTEALDAYAATSSAEGPYLVKGYELGDTAPLAVREDMQAFFDAGKTITALEFMTAVKGPNCDAICQEAGSGQTTAEQAAAAYDEDCKKQALQLGLNWE
uniref:Putative extracellular solutebinding protein family 1 n=1 Tax=termite gut metagenome TaxID=433724 RepID=S0DF82_9ZZZZ